MLRRELLKLGEGMMDEVGGGPGDLRNGVRTASRMAFFVFIFSCFIFAMSFCFLFFGSEICERSVF